MWDLLFTIMAIFVTGDTHGDQKHGWMSVDGFMHRFNTESFPEQKELSKTDYVVICGDFGGVWDTNRFEVKESPAEKDALDWLERKPFTTLFIPGNHENYDRLMGCKNEALMDSWFYAKLPAAEKKKLRQGYPRKQWHGGFVRELRPSVLMLERGYIFVIDGKYCFAFGGAGSHDIQDGILDPACFPDEASFKEAYKAKRGQMFRVRGISWWDEEMPSLEEMERGRRTLQAFAEKQGTIDLVFTHDAPASDKLYMGYSEIDELSCFLESLKDVMHYGKWFYGHLHDNRRVFENHYLLYEQIVQIG